MDLNNSPRRSSRPHIKPREYWRGNSNGESQKPAKLRTPKACDQQDSPAKGPTVAVAAPKPKEIAQGKATTGGSGHEHKEVEQHSARGQVAPTSGLFAKTQPPQPAFDVGKAPLPLARESEAAVAEGAVAGPTKRGRSRKREKENAGKLSPAAAAGSGDICAGVMASPQATLTGAPATHQPHSARKRLDPVLATRIAVIAFSPEPFLPALHGDDKQRVLRSTPARKQSSALAGSRGGSSVGMLAAEAAGPEKLRERQARTSNLYGQQRDPGGGGAQECTEERPRKDAKRAHKRRTQQQEVQEPEQADVQDPGREQQGGVGEAGGPRKGEEEAQAVLASNAIPDGEVKQRKRSKRSRGQGIQELLQDPSKALSLSCSPLPVQPDAGTAPLPPSCVPQPKGVHLPDARPRRKHRRQEDGPAQYQHDGDLIIPAAATKEPAQPAAGLKGPTPDSLFSPPIATGATPQACGDHGGVQLEAGAVGSAMEADEHDDELKPKRRRKWRADGHAPLGEEVAPARQPPVVMADQEPNQGVQEDRPELAIPPSSGANAGGIEVSLEPQEQSLQRQQEDSGKPQEGPQAAQPGSSQICRAPQPFRVPALRTLTRGPNQQPWISRSQGQALRPLVNPLAATAQTGLPEANTANGQESRMSKGILTVPSSTHEMRKRNTAQQGPEGDWTPEQVQALQEVAGHVEGKTAAECFEHVYGSDQAREERTALSQLLRRHAPATDGVSRSGEGRAVTVAAARLWMKRQHEREQLERLGLSIRSARSGDDNTEHEETDDGEEPRRGRSKGRKGAVSGPQQRQLPYETWERRLVLDDTQRSHSASRFISSILRKSGGWAKYQKRLLQGASAGGPPRAAAQAPSSRTAPGPLALASKPPRSEAPPRSERVVYDERTLAIRHLLAKNHAADLRQAWREDDAADGREDEEGVEDEEDCEEDEEYEEECMRHFLMEEGYIGLDGKLLV